MIVTQFICKAAWYGSTHNAKGPSALTFYRIGVQANTHAQTCDQNVFHRGGGAGPADRAAAGPIFLIVGGGAPRGLEHVGR